MKYGDIVLLFFDCSENMIVVIIVVLKVGVVYIVLLK